MTEQSIRNEYDGAEQNKNGVGAATISDFLHEGLHIDPSRISRWLRTNPELYDDLLRLMVDLRHMPRPGSKYVFEDAERTALTSRLLWRIAETHAERETGEGRRGTGKSTAPLAFLTKDDVLDAFLRVCQDGRTDAVVRWCRAFPTFAVDIIDAASMLVLSSLGVPSQQQATDPEERARRQSKALERAEALLREEALEAGFP